MDKIKDLERTLEESCVNRDKIKLKLEEKVLENKRQKGLIDRLKKDVRE